jgi:hypothetical protein
MPRRIVDVDVDVERLHGRNCILGAYLTQRQDGQSGEFWVRDAVDLVQGWLRSCVATGEIVVLVHDSLSAASREVLRSRHEPADARGSRIGFVEVELGDFNANDERFFLAALLLERLGPKSVFLTDVTDVIVAKSPFPLLERRAWGDFINAGSLWWRWRRGQLRTGLRDVRRALARSRFALFVGGEEWIIGASAWMVGKLERAYGSVPPAMLDCNVLNCGIVGGKAETVRALLEEVCVDLEKVDCKGELMDMPVFNRILWERHAGEVYFNGVLNSPFKSFLAPRGRRPPYVFYHK